jgi:UDP-N-acetylglucosamine 3-dehydrogenase
MPSPVRVALLGCGALAEILADRVYPAVRDEVQVVAAVDVVEERAGELAARLGARAFTSLEAACAETGPDGVDVRLPHHLHLEGARMAAAVGLPFLMEKPMATTVAAAREVAELGRGIGPSSGVSENYGFLEPVVAARRLLEEGVIGDLLTVQSTRVFELGAEWRRDGWRTTTDSDAQGVVLDQATHVARLLRTVVGEIDEVYALTTTGRRGSVDSASVACRFACGVAGTQSYCWACPSPRVPESIPEVTLFGSAGSIAVHVAYDGRGGGALVERPGRSGEWHGTGTNYYDSLAAVLRDWAGAVREERAPAASLEEGIRDVAVMAAVAESSLRGAPVSVQRVLDVEPA